MHCALCTMHYFQCHPIFTVQYLNWVQGYHVGARVKILQKCAMLALGQSVNPSKQALFICVWVELKLLGLSLRFNTHYGFLNLVLKAKLEFDLGCAQLHARYTITVSACMDPNGQLA